MSKTTLKLMAQVRRRLGVYLRLEQTHCGHEELVEKADRARKGFLEYLAKEIDVLARKAGEP